MKGPFEKAEGGIGVEDKHIVDMFWARNEDALVETQKKYEKYGMYIAGHLLGNREDAAECFNDALQRLWKAIPPHRPEKLSAFLGKIVRICFLACGM